MKVPYCRYAYVPKKKLSYLTSFTQPSLTGRRKAVIFQSRGFNESNLDLLEKQLLKIVYTCEVVKIWQDEWGKRYNVIGFIDVPRGQPIHIKIGWIIYYTKRSPRLVTVHPV